MARQKETVTPHEGCSMDGVEVVGTFKPAVWLHTAAMAIAQRHGAKITVKVTTADEDERAELPRKERLAGAVPQAD